MTSPLVLLGVGKVALAVVAHCREATAQHTIFGTTRRPARRGELAASGLEPLVLQSTDGTDQDAELARVVNGARVIVSFPPDAMSDLRLARCCSGAAGIVYISSTAVYGEEGGVIDGARAPNPTTSRSVLRRQAELVWQNAGAAILRAPSIYGTNDGILARLRRGTWRTPGDGTTVVSRIHVEDLAALALAAVEPAHRRATFVVGDHEPAPIGEVVAWLCAHYELPAPQSIPLSEAPETLRHGRAIDPRDALARLGVTLRYPTYRDGFAVRALHETGGAAR